MNANASSLEWSSPTRVDLPQDGHLHVWRLNVNGVKSNHARKILSKEEQRRADRYVFEEESRRFIVARAMLRYLLARYLHIQPENVNFVFNEYGKPFLKDKALRHLQFNVSHSNYAGAFIFSQKVVGIDIEYHKPGFAAMDIARRFFSKQEVLDLETVAPETYADHFFDCWSRKESYIKAKGFGVSLPLESFTTRLVNENTAKLEVSRLYPQDPNDFEIIPFRPYARFSGAVTAEKPVEHIHFFDGQAFFQSQC